MQFQKIFVRLATLALIAFLPATAAAAGKPISLARIPHIHVLAFDPVDPEKLLIATTRGLYRVDRAGKLETLLDEHYEIAGFLMSDDGQKILVSGKKDGKGLGLLQSTNGGFSWYQHGIGDTPKFAMRALINTDRHLKNLYAVSKVLAQSSDGGKSWRQIGPLPPGLIGLIAPGPGHLNLLAATAKGPRESFDGGQEWVEVKAGSAGRPASMIARGFRGDAFTFIVGEGLFVRRGGNAYWSRLAPAKDFDGALIKLLSDGKSRRHMIVLTQYMKIFETRDGGQTWKKFLR